MRSYTRHQLKQDSFATSTADTISWAVENRSAVTVAAIAVAVILAIVIGGWAYIGYRDAQAKADLAGALQKYGAPIRPAGTPATADVLSYGSTQERDQAANAEFVRIANRLLGHRRTSQVARYFAGITFRGLNNNAEAEKDLQKRPPAATTRKSPAWPRWRSPAFITIPTATCKPSTSTSN